MKYLCIKNGENKGVYQSLIMIFTYQYNIVNKINLYL